MNKETRLRTAAQMLRAQGRGIVPFAHSSDPARAQTVIDGFHRLIQEPLEVTDRWEFDLDGRGDLDDGLIRRTGGEHDWKWFFHYRPRLRDALRKRPGTRVEHYEDWLTACADWYFESLVATIEFAEYLDNELPGHGIAARIRHGTHVLRFLSYDPPQGENREIAASHTDKGALTLHAAENYPGLEIDGSPWISKPGSALVFPGAKLERLTGGKVSALSHRAVDIGLRLPGEDRRWAIVFFAHIDEGVE